MDVGQGCQPPYSYFIRVPTDKDVNLGIVRLGFCPKTSKYMYTAVQITKETKVHVQCNSLVEVDAASECRVDV